MLALLAALLIPAFACSATAANTPGEEDAQSTPVSEAPSAQAATAEEPAPAGLPSKTPAALATLPAPPSSTPTPTRTSVPPTLAPPATGLPAPVINIRADATTIAEGDCTILRWDVDYIDSIYLDGAGVIGHDSRSVCPPVTTTYTFTINLLGGGTVTNTVTITVMPAPSATIPPTAVATLNFSLPPNYGSASLTSGFVPDPYTKSITAGGPANVSYLGGGCTGYATSAPDFSLNYTSGAFPTLRFYFIGSGDTTLIINTPGGSYVCADDSFGTLNPTIDFNSPSSGRYDVWVGSYAPDAYISGTLYITENTGYHP
jgi:hypothetical protein